LKGIETGDGAALKGPQMQVSNAVYNKIRSFSIKEAKRKSRIHDKSEKSTSDQVSYLKKYKLKSIRDRLNMMNLIVPFILGV